MKANEAPEIIHTSLVSDRIRKTKPNSDEYDEYIRTDAFIKRTEDFLYEQLLLGNIDCGNITKLIENFKKQIKGEKQCT